MLTSTSTEFLVLSTKIEYLINSFDWIVGGIGVVVTIVLVLVGLGNFFYTRRLTQEEVEKLKEETKGLVQKNLDEGSTALRSLIEDEFSFVRRDIEDRFKNQDTKIEDLKSVTEGEEARLFALLSATGSVWEMAFLYWLKAAYWYSKNVKNKSLLTTALKSADKNLNKITDIENLRKHLPDVEYYLKALEHLRETEITLLREKLIDKLKEKNKAEATPTSPKKI